MKNESDERFLFEDVMRVAEASDTSAFAGKNVLVTGATGLIGRQTVLSLLCASRVKNENIHVIASVRDTEKAGRLFAGVLGRKDFSILGGGLDALKNISGNVDYIVHAASPTTSKEFAEHPAEVINSITGGTETVLALAKEKKSSGVVYLSSLEMYGITAADLESVSETDYGYIDPLRVRSCYSEGKRMAECLCAAYASEYGVPVKVARLAQTFGTGVTDSEKRVVAQFARAAVEGRDIVLHTEGLTYHNYCYTADAVRAILLLLVKGVTGEAYNVANMSAAGTIREMAELVCRLYPGTRLRFEIDGENRGYAPTVHVALSTKKLEALGWKAETSYEDMFRRMIEDMKQLKQNGKS